MGISARQKLRKKKNSAQFIMSRWSEVRGQSLQQELFSLETELQTASHSELRVCVFVCVSAVLQSLGVSAPPPPPPLYSFFTSPAPPLILLLLFRR